MVLKIAAFLLRHQRNFAFQLIGKHLAYFYTLTLYCSIPVNKKIIEILANHLKVRFNHLYGWQEYLSSDDAQEACRCLKELEVPHFHHELVYEVKLNYLMLMKMIERVTSILF